MKDQVRVALGQIDVAWMQPASNLERITRAVEQATDEGPVDLILFPELANSGYVKGRDKDFGRDYFKLAEPVPGPFVEALGKVAARHHVYLVTGFLEAHPLIPGSVYNSSVMVGPAGEVLGVHHKMHIPGEERHYFYPGNTIVVVPTELGRIGLMVCADRRFPELARVLTLKGAEIICSVANIPGAERAAADPEGAYFVPRCRAMENRLFFAEVNRVGTQEELRFRGQSCVAGPAGDLLARSEGTCEEIVRATMCGDAMLEQRAIFPDFRDRRPEHYRLLCEPYERTH